MMAIFSVKVRSALASSCVIYIVKTVTHAKNKSVAINAIYFFMIFNLNNYKFVKTLSLNSPMIERRKINTTAINKAENI